MDKLVLLTAIFFAYSNKLYFHNTDTNPSRVLLDYRSFLRWVLEKKIATTCINSTFFLYNELTKYIGLHDCILMRSCTNINNPINIHFDHITQFTAINWYSVLIFLCCSSLKILMKRQKIWQNLTQPDFHYCYVNFVLKIWVNHWSVLFNSR